MRDPGKRPFHRAQRSVKVNTIEPPQRAGILWRAAQIPETSSPRENGAEPYRESKNVKCRERSADDHARIIFTSIPNATFAESRQASRDDRRENELALFPYVVAVRLRGIRGDSCQRAHSIYLAALRAAQAEGGS